MSHPASTRRGEPFDVGYHQRKVVVVRQLSEGFLGMFGGVREGPAGKAYIAAVETAQRELELPAGHPLVDEVYAGHPLVARRYLPVAQFHRSIFDEKVHEFMRLLAALGATRVRYACVEGFRRGHEGRASVEIPLGHSGGGGLSRAETHGQQVHFEEVYDVRRAPHVPDDLVWFAHEVSWRELARRRIEQGTRSFRASLVQEDSYGIDADLLLGIEGVGVTIRGRFEAFRSSRWDFEGEFAPLEATSPAPSSPAPPSPAPPSPAPAPPTRSRVPPRAAVPPTPAAAASAVKSAQSCGACHAAITPGDRFCDHCGAPVGAPRACGACATAALPDERFCSACGASLGG